MLPVLSGPKSSISRGNALEIATNVSHVKAEMNLQHLNMSEKNINDKEQVKKLSEEFEAIFLEIVLKSMRESIPKSKLIDGGNGEEIFRSMLDSEYAKSLASQRSTGLADSIQSHLLGLIAGGKPANIIKSQVINRYQQAK